MSEMDFNLAKEIDRINSLPPMSEIMFKEIRSLEIQNAILIEALENIKKHNEIIVGEFSIMMPTTWHIASKALQKAKEIDGKQNG